VSLRRVRLRLAPVAVLALAGIAAGGRSAPRHVRVELRELSFHPERLRLAPGDTVTWINRDLVPHTVTGPPGRPDSGEIPPGGRFTLAVTSALGGRYVCRYHPAMTANLRVD